MGPRTRLPFLLFFAIRRSMSQYCDDLPAQVSSVHLLQAMPGSRNAPSNRPGSRAKNWCFTINNPTPEDYALFPLPTALVQYCIYGREIGDDGTPHLQGYVQFRNRIRFNKVKELLPRSHLEVQRARSNSAAKEYCEKEDPTPHEEGGVHAFRQRRSGIKHC